MEVGVSDEENELVKQIKEQVNEFHKWGHYRSLYATGYPENITPAQKSQWEKFDNEPRSNDFYGVEPIVSLTDIKKLLKDCLAKLDNLHALYRAGQYPEEVFSSLSKFTLGQYGAYRTLYETLTGGKNPTDDEIRRW